MAVRVRLVALVGWSVRSSWNSKEGVRHEPITEYEHVLLGEFDVEPGGAEVGEALGKLRATLAEGDGLAELQSHALMDEATWERFRSAAGRAGGVIQGTGVGALIRSHRSLREAIDDGNEAGATFLGADGASPGST